VIWCVVLMGGVMFGVGEWFCYWGVLVRFSVGIWFVFGVWGLCFCVIVGVVVVCGGFCVFLCGMVVVW